MWDYGILFLCYIIKCDIALFYVFMNRKLRREM